ncbi:ABC transporter permease [Cytophaga hutchinsonii]|uniref:Lipoprotein ABC transporter, permease n=1 Tax=Cytophaga hutchinsonii (strain ATCC 33406 / DSM 1761 / CIP 103989 / NBRC 15051 / NCIMB 9469 / D465) TaxID=269798 RepID=A0A6N4SX57_CYTH3|nr:FtsX-like permease family protein [Cytophaga hutchinsonii]ABG60861.1 lipoprotein ABC transporter, permease [Cytophaga hutchinsonii ATCC 33406]SFY00126.1 lipoprotein-releasing system permease protein [Cytophaga hutchinsonii ATCC 33406]
MKAILFIARHYYFSGKNLLLINVISILSILVVAIITMSLVIGMSVFNGMENLIRSLYNSFDPEIKISPRTGKTFEMTDSLHKLVQSAEGVFILTEVIEDNAVISYKNETDVIKIKGVSENFTAQHRMDSFLVSGSMSMFKQGRDFAIIGRGIQYKLSIPINNQFSPVQIFYPDRDKIKRPDALDAFRIKSIHAGGVFAIEKQYDDNFVFVPLVFAKELMNYENERTSLEIKVSSGYEVEDVQSALKERLGDTFLVLNSDEQHKGLLKAIKVEKFVVNVMLSFILAISSVGIFFCLTMLTLNKRKDIAVLKAMGSTKAFIRNLFMTEGMLIALSGAVIGMGLGIGICLLQQYFGFVTIGTETSVIEEYPVELRYTDLFWIAGTVICISFLASIRPSIIASRIDVKKHL